MTANRSGGTYHDGGELRLRRRRLGLSQARLAGDVGCTPAHMCNLESEKVGASPGLLLKLADRLGCKVIDLERRPGDDEHDLPDDEPVLAAASAGSRS